MISYALTRQDGETERVEAAGFVLHPSGDLEFYSDAPYAQFLALYAQGMWQTVRRA